MAALKQPREVRELDPDGRLSELRDWECWARDVLHCKLVRTEADLHNDATTFHPVYTHQCTPTPLRSLYFESRRPVLILFIHCVQGHSV